MFDSRLAEGADRRLARRTDLCRADCAASLDRPRQHGAVHLFILCFILLLLLLLIHLESAHRSRRARVRRAAALVSDQRLAQWRQWQWQRQWFGGTRGEMRRGVDARRAARRGSVGRSQRRRHGYVYVPTVVADGQSITNMVRDGSP